MSDGFTKFKKGIQLDPQSADPSSPAEGDLHYSDGTARSAGLWQYKGAAWVRVPINPTTTNGDILYYDGTDLQRLAIGSNGEVLQVSGGNPAWASSPVSNSSVTTKTAAYTIATSDDIILADTTSAGFTLTLPTASGNTGKIFEIKKIDSTNNIVTIDGNGSETIDGDTTKKLATQNEAVTITSDGTNWVVLSRTGLVTKPTTFTPSFTNLSYSSQTLEYSRRGGHIHIQGRVVVSSISGTVSLALPNSLTASISQEIPGSQALDASTGNRHRLNVAPSNGSNNLGFVNPSISGGSSNLDATNPFTWTSGDRLEFNVFIPIQEWEDF
jgi:hypothetical protein